MSTRYLHNECIISQWNCVKQLLYQHINSYFQHEQTLYLLSDMFDLQINSVITMIIISYGTMIPMNQKYRNMTNYS